MSWEQDGIGLEVSPICQNLYFWSHRPGEQWPRSPSTAWLCFCLKRDSPSMLRNPASRNSRPQPRHWLSRSLAENNCVKHGDLRSPKPCKLFMNAVFRKWAQDEETLSEPDLASTLSVRASYEKTSVNIAITSSKVEDKMHGMLLRVKRRDFQKVLARQVEFWEHLSPN